MGSLGLVTHGILSESYFEFTYALEGIMENIIEIEGILEGV